MRNWKTLAVGLGVVLMAGLAGRWTGPIPQPSLAQDTRKDPTQPAGKSSEADRGWIGLMVEEDAEHAIRVADVFPGGPSAFASIRQGDVLLEVAGTKIRSEKQLAETVEKLKPGQDMVVIVQRGERKRSLKIRVGSLREFHEHYAREMWRRDPRNPNYTESLGVSQADLTVEMFRRLFEQNERLERSLLAVRQEVSELRRELKAKTKENR